MSPAQRVRELFSVASIVAGEQFNEEGDPNVVIVKGIANNFAFVKAKLEEIREPYKVLALSVLHENFKKPAGGWSFLNLPAGPQGDLWCEQPTAEIFLALGLALGVAEYCAQHEIWPFLPGGVPYVVFDL